jgi:hypothetical protein
MLPRHINTSVSHLSRYRSTVFHSSGKFYIDFPISVSRNYSKDKMSDDEEQYSSGDSLSKRLIGIVSEHLGLDENEVSTEPTWFILLYVTTDVWALTR